MSQELKILLFVTLFHTHVAFASDPDPVLDFCIPFKENPSCKNSSAVTVEDFTFSGIKFPGNYSQTGFSAMPVNSNVFPGLNTLGMSFVRADFDVGGVNGLCKSDRKRRGYGFPQRSTSLPNECWRYGGEYFGEFQQPKSGLAENPKCNFWIGIEEKLLEKAFGLNAMEIAKLRKRFVPH
ncbi:hypothetical protein SLA2020_276690 [Shorea laevis]